MLQKTIRLFSVFLIFAFASDPLSTARAQGAKEKPVTQEQFNRLDKSFKEWAKYLKKKTDDLEQKSAKKSGESNGDETITDFSGASSANKGQPSAGAPTFKTYFDLDFVSRPGLNAGRTDLTFDSYHTFLFFEINPTPEIQFSFEVNPSPRFFELDLQATPRLQVRLGKIWIPFDDISAQSPHTIFGGRTNISKISPNTLTFLPDIWADLGLGLKYQLVDTSSLAIETHGYIVNGFGQGGSDPRGVASEYPSFSNPTIGTDNNRDKGYGFRGHALFFHRLGLGASYYKGRWNNEDLNPAGLNLMGLDSQLHLGTTELRAGIASMKVKLTSGTEFKRGGYYGEIGQKIGRLQQWKALVRGGSVQLDDRALSTNDQKIIGAALLFRPGLIQYSIEHSRDTKKLAGKTNYTYSAARVIIAL